MRDSSLGGINIHTDEVRILAGFPKTPQLLLLNIALKPHLQQSFSLDIRPRSHKYSASMTAAWTSWPKITRSKSPAVKTHDVTMPELAEIQRIYTISKRKKLSELFQKNSSWHVTL